jgi:DNA polymerase
MDLMVVGEAPSHTRPKGMENVAFSGKTSYILWDELKEYNITREDCYVTNVVAEQLLRGKRPDENLINKNRPRLEKEIEEQEPLVILAVGKIASNTLLNKDVRLLANAGNIFKDKKRNLWIVPCIHPSAVARNKVLKKPFKDCIWIAAKVLEEIRNARSERHQK